MARPQAFDESIVTKQAMQLFWRRGYRATAIKDIERATGLKPSSLYNRFGSKDGLFTHVLSEYIEQVVIGRCRKYLQAGSVVDGIQQYIRGCFVGPLAPFGCLLVNTSAELGPHSDEVAAQVRRGMAIAAKELERALLRGQAAGEICAACDCAFQARHIGLLMNGILVNGKSCQFKPQWLEQTFAIVDQHLEGLKS